MESSFNYDRLTHKLSRLYKQTKGNVGKLSTFYSLCQYWEIAKECITYYCECRRKKKLSQNEFKDLIEQIENDSLINMNNIQQKKQPYFKNLATQTIKNYLEELIYLQNIN
ncbi:hypothetical protein TTHERM_000443078 (macronuclear) [Tetrahymena thermophila SB210]|uniref:Uncharacterized protein n=1 Tax=Tetrahymena thermophila (strain SB210) TaxID=312017 RepID=W7X9I9_TETTS|nr:hypothetical protein TTHERM_000443078 [Tetrahymena thermophila SB210]EWS74017.1 hypothetical protein TTHERM_000443078 [Tetrahymena thermophila SB210]|eukprot:XP_012653479.1 hypothetical protein TTHERM_000443078 [Tetrahymena thermophila SB210]